MQQITHSSRSARTKMRAGGALVLLALAGSLGLYRAPAEAAVTEGVIIDNGTVRLGIHHFGELIHDDVGIQYIANGNEAISPGCWCEGWGLADRRSGVRGYANQANDTAGLVVERFTCTATTAVSRVKIGNTFRVTHDFRPSAESPFLYECLVTIRNLSSRDVFPRYRRVMDWDVEPTAFSEYVTVERGASRYLDYSSDDGFASSDPLSGPSFLLDGTENVSFQDSGPDDHGALFDFNLDPIRRFGEFSFKIYYGVAPSEDDALAALASINAEVYSLGQPDVAGGPDLGEPNTFIFAFANVGGAPTVGGLNSGNLQVKCIRPSEATICWQTTSEADTCVEWGTTPALGRKLYVAESTRNHAVTLQGLTPRTVHFFRVRSRDTDGNEVVIDGGSFATARFIRTARGVVSGLWLRRVGDNLLATVSVTNVHTAPLLDLRVERVFLLVGVRLVEIRPVGLPAEIGNLAPGQCADVYVVFPGSLGTPGQVTRLLMNGRFTGGAFGELMETVLP